jgi:hypothetical protein
MRLAGEVTDPVGHRGAVFWLGERSSGQGVQQRSGRGRVAGLVQLLPQVRPGRLDDIGVPVIVFQRR